MFIQISKPIISYIYVVALYINIFFFKERYSTKRHVKVCRHLKQSKGGPRDDIWSFYKMPQVGEKKSLINNEKLMQNLNQNSNNKTKTKIQPPSQAFQLLSVITIQLDDLKSKANFFVKSKKKSFLVWNLTPTFQGNDLMHPTTLQVVTMMRFLELQMTHFMETV